MVKVSHRRPARRLRVRARDRQRAAGQPRQPAFDAPARRARHIATPIAQPAGSNRASSSRRRHRASPRRKSRAMRSSDRANRNRVSRNRANTPARPVSTAAGQPQQGNIARANQPGQYQQGQYQQGQRPRMVMAARTAMPDAVIRDGRTSVPVAHRAARAAMPDVGGYRQSRWAAQSRQLEQWLARRSPLRLEQLPRAEPRRVPPAALLRTGRVRRLRLSSLLGRHHARPTASTARITGSGTRTTIACRPLMAPIAGYAIITTRCSWMCAAAMSSTRSTASSGNAR